MLKTDLPWLLRCVESADTYTEIKKNEEKRKTEQVSLQIEDILEPTKKITFRK